MEGQTENSENASQIEFIMELEQMIKEKEYSKSSEDINEFMKVSHSLTSLLENEKTICHLRDFVSEERCEENVYFIEDVMNYKEQYDSENFTLERV